MFIKTGTLCNIMVCQAHFHIMEAWSSHYLSTSMTEVVMMSLYKLTGTDGHAGRQTVQVSIGMHVHP